MSIPGTAHILKPTVITDAMVTSCSVAEPDGGEFAWSASEICAAMEERYIASPSSTVTITNSGGGAPAVVTWANCPLAEGTPLVFTTTDTLPTGITEDAEYFVKDRLSANTFTVSATRGGRAVRTTAAGSGTHTATARVHMVYEALVGAKGTVTITNASPAVATWVAHGRAAGDPIVFTTDDALPAGVTAGTTYYVIATGLTADAFQFSATAGGAAINTSSAGSGTHTCGLAANYNKPPMLNPAVWGESRPTNAWGGFDGAAGTVIYGPSPLSVVLRPGQLGGSGVLSIKGAHTLTWTVNDGPGGAEVYTREVDLENTVVNDVYDFLYEEITFRTDVAVVDMPSHYFDPEVTITLEGGGYIEVGKFLVGRVWRIGGTQQGAQARMMDFSTKETDDYGRTTFTERDFSKRATLTVLADNTEFERIYNLLTSLRAKPALYIGSTKPGLAPIMVDGIARDWVQNLTHDHQHNCSLELEGIST